MPRSNEPDSWPDEPDSESDFIDEIVTEFAPHAIPCDERDSVFCDDDEESDYMTLLLDDEEDSDDWPSRQRQWDTTDY